MLAKNDTRVNPAEPQLTITRVFDAPRELVFQCWSDPVHIARWWGPKGFTAPVIKIDFRVGGSFHFCMRSPDGKDYWNKGAYNDIVTPEKIISTMHFSDEQGNFVHPSKYGLNDYPAEIHDTVTFAPEGSGKTRLTLHRDTPISISKRYMEDQGWSQSLDRFATEVARAREGN